MACVEVRVDQHFELASCRSGSELPRALTLENASVMFKQVFNNLMIAGSCCAEDSTCLLHCCLMPAHRRTNDISRSECKYMTEHSRDASAEPRLGGSTSNRGAKIRRLPRINRRSSLYHPGGLPILLWVLPSTGPTGRVPIPSPSRTCTVCMSDIQHGIPD